MRRHLRRLGDDGGIHIGYLPTFSLHQSKRMAQQRPAISAFELGIGIGEVLTNVAQGSGAKQGIGQSM